MVKQFCQKDVDDAFEKRAEREATAEILTTITLLDFTTYEEFDAYQSFKQHIWVEALMGLGCRSRDDLDEQYSLFGDVFRKFHSTNFKWLQNQSLCPQHIKEAREKELLEIIDEFRQNKKCHWTRQHEFFCFCDERE